MASSELSLQDALIRPVITAVRERLYAQGRIPLSAIQVRMGIDHTADHLVTSLTVDYLKKQLPPVFKTVKTPTTVWQHFKHQYAPAWFKRRFPVVYETHKFQVQGPMFLCPHLADRYDNTALHVRFMNMAEPLNTFRMAMEEAKHGV